MDKDIPQGIQVVSDKPMKLGRKRNNWFAIKQEYFANPDLTILEVAKKYGIPQATVYNRSQIGGWAKDKSIVWAKAERRAQDIQIEKNAEIKARHALIGKLLQKTGIEAIKHKKAQIKNPKDALEFTTEGVRIEREAQGLDRQVPQIVNIVAQQQGVIDKYKQ